MTQNKVKHLFFTVITIAASLSFCNAQQVPIYSQYIFNGLAINPAFAGSAVQLSINSIYRNQWVNFEGAPTTVSLSGHTALNKGKVGVGLLLDYDKIGSYSNTHAYASYAYIIKSPLGKLALGLQAGFNVLASDYSELNLDNLTDGSFSNFSSKLKPNFGAGIYFHNKLFYAGFSVPYLLNSKISSDFEGLLSEIKGARYYYLNGGITLPMNRERTIELMPSMLIRAQEGSPLSLDINAAVVFYKSFSIGASYRNIDALVSYIDIKISDQFLFAYSYDWTTSDISQYSNGTHEFMLNYRIRINKIHGVAECPQYFRFD